MSETGGALAGLEAEHLALEPEQAAQLLVDVAHDLRSPLASMLFLLERVRSGASGPLTPLMERQLALVHSATFGLSAVVTDLMEVGRSGTQLLDAPPERFALDAMLRSVRDIVQPIAEEKGLAVRVAAPAGVMRVGNVAALRRVLLNLATNAVKFTSRGSVDLLAEVGTAAEVRFIVQDSGRGLPAAVRDAARGVPLHEDAGFSSAGLGLSICRRLVVGLGGTLEVRSEPERGTRFDVVLELAR